MSDLRYGPWSPTCAAGERERQLRCLSAIAYMVCGPHHDLWKLLRQAESDELAFGEAYAAMERLPALTRRRILGTYNAVTWPRQPRREAAL
jgi:hypothetical protein